MNKGTQKNLTRILASFVSEQPYEALPAEAVKFAKLMMLDSLGCALGGYTLAREEVGWVVEFVKNQCIGGPATIWADGSKTTSAYAALANGTMVHTIDFDDTHMGSVTHFGSSLLGTTFALGEQLGASGRAVIGAFILGLEAGARVGRCVMPSHYRYWHPTATFGGIGSAAAAARLLKLDPLQTEQVIGHAADAAGGMRYCIEKGDYSKSFHPGLAAMKAIIFALIVDQGASGPLGFLEYPSGFCNAFSEAPDYEPLVKDLGQRYEVMEESLKSFPTIQCSHTAIATALDLIEGHGLEADDIEAVRIVHTATVPGQGCGYAPDTPLAGRLSIPFCIALAAFDRKVTLAQFTRNRLDDPKIKAFMSRVSIEPDQDFCTLYPETIAAFVDIETKRGQVYSGSQIYPKGDPRNRMSATEIQSKFRGLALNTLESDRVERIITAMLGLDQVENIREVTASLKATSIDGS